MTAHPQLGLRGSLSTRKIIFVVVENYVIIILSNFFLLHPDGSPYKTRFSSSLWMKSKQGELPGYRSSVTIVEGLKIGIFTSALISEVDEKSVWTIPGEES